VTTSAFIAMTTWNETRQKQPDKKADRWDDDRGDAQLYNNARS
jgi:hypothetical protein